MSRRQCVINLCFGVALSMLAGLATAADHGVALVIGNSKYQNASQLPNPANDAQLVAKFFRDIKFEVVVAKTDLGAADIRQALRDFTVRAVDADIAIVFYAGHGIEIGGVNYLIPVDAKLATDLDAADEAVSLDRVLAAIEPARKLRLVMLDACRDNPFIAKMRRLSATRSIGRGLGEVDIVTRDTLVAFAAKAGSTATDGSGSNSPFTTALVSSLGIPGLDLRIAFGLVRDEVLKATRNRQEPWVYGTLGGNVVSLVPGPKNFSPDSATVHPVALPPANAAPALAPLQLPQGRPALGVSLNDKPQLLYSPWLKVCDKSKDPNGKPLCVVTKDGRLENGMPVAVVQLFEPEGQPRTLRVTVPLGMQLQHGTRVIIDQGAPITEPYKICFPVGCMSDYPVTDDMIIKMKAGKLITLQAINMQGSAISMPLPLADFAKAYDGPPTDPKTFEDQQRKLQSELQKKAEEARRRLEQAGAQKK